MSVKPACPFGRYVEGMKIDCEKTGQRCVHVFYRRCKGWWANTEQAARCPVREENR